MLGATQVDKDQERQTKAEPRPKSTSTLFWLLLVAVLTLVAYSPVLFNWFAGDDYVHLYWLKDAVERPELLWRNFHSSWLDGTTTKFYRPLISVFMFSDYLLYGVNGLGFRLTNLIFHIGSVGFLYLIVRDLYMSFKSDSERAHYLPYPVARVWGIAAAAIFALYPLHPEAVSWITGRVDSVVTTFVLASLWFYIKWRLDKGAGWMALALSCMGLGLLSKEMAVTLPPTFLAYELTRQIAAKPNLRGPFALLSAIAKPKTLLAIAMPTLPFFALLGLYFILRYFALGTVVGGYDDSLFFVANWKDFGLSWLHAVKMMLVPVNKELLGSHNVLVKLWLFSLAAIVAFASINLVRDRNSRLVFLFGGFWLALALVPVYKIFAIADDLQGSRLAYLATVPLSLLLACSFANIKRESIHSITRQLTCVLALLFLALNGGLLWLNNQPWKQAGIENNAIKCALNEIYKQLKGDPQVLFVGLPDQIHGAYTCRNSLAGMTASPQMHRSVNNCLAINPFEPIFPFGYLKESLQQAGSQVKIFSWSEKDSKFHQILLPSEKTVPSLDLSLIRAPGQAGSPLVLEAGPKGATFDIGPLDLSCWNTDFLAMEVERASGTNHSIPVELLYTNELCPRFRLKQRSHSELSADKETDTLIFALRGLPEWALGGQCKALQLMLPPNTRLKIKSLYVADKTTISPQLSFENSAYLGNKGYLHLGGTRGLAELAVNGKNMQPQAKYLELEISRNNLLFEEQNSKAYSNVSWRKLRAEGPQAVFKLKAEDFPQVGIYEIRARAFNAEGVAIGLSSDHIVLAVDGIDTARIQTNK